MKINEYSWKSMKIHENHKEKPWNQRSLEYLSSDTLEPGEISVLNSPIPAEYAGLPPWISWSQSLWKWFGWGDMRRGWWERPIGETSQATYTKRKIPRESFQPKYPKRKFPSERSKAKVPNRKIPSERSKRKFPSEGSQTKVPKRKIPSEIPQANDAKRKIPN